MRAMKIQDGTDPGATLGRVFTASIGQETIVAEDNFLDHVRIGINGAIATAAVVIETFAGLLSEYSLRVGPEFRLLGNLADFVALMAFYYHRQPTIGENTDATGNDFIGGVMLPVQAPADAAKPFTHASTRTAQTNVATEVLAETGHWAPEAGGKKPVHAVVITFTSAATAGYQTLDFRVAPVGRLIGIIIAGPAAGGLTDGNVDISVQRVRVLVNGIVRSQFNALADPSYPQMIDYVTPNPAADLIRPYQMYDLRPEGIDTREAVVTLQIDVQDVSDALRLMPVLEME